LTFSDQIIQIGKVSFPKNKQELNSPTENPKDAAPMNAYNILAPTID